jgi:hypothetical protein
MPGNRTRKRKTTTMTKLIAATTLILMLTSAADAGSWLKIERPCGSKCPVVQSDASRPQAFPMVGAVRFREFKEPTYQSRTVITSDYGTSVYTFRSYSR